MPLQLVLIITFFGNLYETALSMIAICIRLGCFEINLIVAGRCNGFYICRRHIINGKWVTGSSPSKQFSVLCGDSRRIEPRNVHMKRDALLSRAHRLVASPLAYTLYWVGLQSYIRIYSMCDAFLVSIRVWFTHMCTNTLLTHTHIWSPYVCGYFFIGLAYLIAGCCARER